MRAITQDAESVIARLFVDRDETAFRRFEGVATARFFALGASLSLSRVPILNLSCERGT